VGDLMGEVYSFHGSAKSGKTTFGFTFPKPMLHLDFDLGRERAIYRFKDVANQIHSVPLPEPPGWAIGSGAATKLWMSFTEVYHRGLSDPNIKTIFWDTGTQVWKANTQEYLETVIAKKNSRRQLLQIEYREPNDRMRSLIMEARQSNKILLIGHYETDDYQEQFVSVPGGSLVKDSVKTGRKLHAGFGEMPFITDSHFYTYVNHVLQPGNTYLHIPYLRIEVTGNFPMNATGYEIAEPSYDKLMVALAMFRGWANG
jgi:hypothetical protein